MENNRYHQDELLVVASQRGDAPAFRQLVDRWNERLLRHAERSTGNADAARDAVQETWLTVITTLHKLERQSAFPAWLFGILRHKCADWHRHRARTYRMTKRLSAHAQPSPADESHSVPDELTKAILRLPPSQRDAVLLFYYEGFSVQEIAEIESAPAGTVKSRLYHARQSLRLALQEETDER